MSYGWILIYSFAYISGVLSYPWLPAGCAVLTAGQLVSSLAGHLSVVAELLKHALALSVRACRSTASPSTVPASVISMPWPIS
jgi:hypothetical protein